MTPPEHADQSRVVSVRLFAAAKQRAGREVATVRLQPGGTIGDLRHALGESLPTLRPLAKHLLFAAGTEYVADHVPVPDGVEMVAFPPVSGG